MFTVRVLSSTKLSLSHKRVIMASLETVLPACSKRISRILCSFLVSSISVFSHVRTPLEGFSTAPLCSRRLPGFPKDYVRRRSAWILAISTSVSKGFAIKSSAPRLIAMTIFILSEAEDIKITGTWEIRRISSHQ